jgi:Raf kinase inhibitor-like YbhB/YbcL family protein
MTLLIVLGTIALFLFLESKGISLNNLNFNKKQTTMVVTEYPEKLKLASKNFAEGESIPEKNTCKGRDISPAFSITNIPSGTKSLTIIVEDPDSPYKIWTHWILYNVDPRSKEIYEGVIPWNALQGENDFGVAEYRGPCPPLGKHRYNFRLYALDTKLDVDEGANRKQIDEAMKGHILDESILMGIFEK